ncbi:MAG TPA: lmo0937 family membrane protein [Gemmatimonadota bacterium]|jgi:hypothetical protein
MLWTIAIILLVLWALGFFVANLGSVVHLLLVFALIAIVYNLITGRGATT